MYLDSEKVSEIRTGKCQIIWSKVRRESQRAQTPAFGLNKLSIQRQERVKCALFHFSHASRLFHCCATASAVEQGLIAGKGSMVWCNKCNILALVFQHPEHVPHQWLQGKTQSRRSWTSRVHKRVAQLSCSLGKTVMKKILIKKTNKQLTAEPLHIALFACSWLWWASASQAGVL